MGLVLSVDGIVLLDEIRTRVHAKWERWRQYQNLLGKQTQYIECNYSYERDLVEDVVALDEKELANTQQ